MSGYNKSEELLERACKTIPLGSQTFSKSKTQLPIGASPFFATHAKGSKFWDVDGNEYVDFTNALLSITLGHCDDDVTDAVSEQLKKGSIFSVGSTLEIEVAEKIVEMVPCAEMVRFGKNGSDATAGAIRVSRAYTGRDHVLVCGYHGWQDWYIGSTTKDMGVPESTKALTHIFEYNNIESLEKLFDEYRDKVAAVILEPTNVYPPKDNFLQKVKEVTAKNGAVLIFDETITGFRYSNGGAQELYGVTPDLATFGKGLANGYPLSAVAGKKEIMQLMEEIFFSFTFGGDTISLAAAHATLTKLQNDGIVDKIRKAGKEVKDRLIAKISENGFEDYFDVLGNDVWSFFTFKPELPFDVWETKTLLEQEMFANGVFMLGTHNMNASHASEDIDKLMHGYQVFFDKLKSAKGNDLKAMIKGEILKPLFKVR